jgi:hypothetical protein
MTANRDYVSRIESLQTALNEIIRMAEMIHDEDLRGTIEHIAREALQRSDPDLAGTGCGGQS